MPPSETLCRRQPRLSWRQGFNLAVLIPPSNRPFSPLRSHDRGPEMLVQRQPRHRQNGALGVLLASFDNPFCLREGAKLRPTSGHLCAVMCAFWLANLAISSNLNPLPRHVGAGRGNPKCKATRSSFFGRVACAYVQPATVKAHALCALPGFPTSGFGRRPEWT